MKRTVILPHQSRFMQAPYLFPQIRFFFNLAGYGAGKTRGLVFAILYAINMLNGKKDRAGDYARIMIAGYTLAHLNKTLLIYLRQTLDNCKIPYFENKKDNFFVVGTVTILIIPMENPENIFGLESWAVFVDELDELTEDKAIEALRALSERCRQRIIGMREPWLGFASTAQGQKGLYRIYMHFKKTGVGFLLLRSKTEDNPFLPASQIRDMRKMYTPEERRVFMDAEFIAIAKGRVLPDFDWERNYLDYDLDTDLKPNETVIIGMDFNVSYNRASAYVVRDGVVYAVKYYDFANPQDAPAVFRYDFPRQKILWVPDVTIKDSFPMFARELRRFDIKIIYRKKSPLVEDSVFLINKLFYTSRLMICKIAKDLAEACALAHRDKDNKIPKGLGPSSPIHAIDGIRYALSFIVTKDSSFSDIRRMILEKRASFRTDSDAPVQDLGGGYSQIEPGALLKRRIA